MSTRASILIILALVAFTGLIIWVNSLSSSPSKITFSPQQTQLFRIDQPSENPINILATTLPQFAFRLVDQKFNNLWQAHASERQTAVTASVNNFKGDVQIEAQTQFDPTKKEVVITPMTANKVKPGLYSLTIKVKTVSGEHITLTQDFTWGVLAINTNKAIYSPGEKVSIGMAVLDDLGTTKCIANTSPIVFGTAKVTLTITSPAGAIHTFSTDDHTISGSQECGDRTVTNKPDFLAEATAAETGKYHLHMEAETLLGHRAIDDTFVVQNAAPDFTIERTQYPTRIYPRADYPVTVSVIANKDYSGPVYDIVPASFKISEVSGAGSTRIDGEFQTITWQVNWKKGQSYGLYYTIDFPPVAPEFYLIGPLTIGTFKEGREWQIASDSIFGLVQESHNSGSSVTTLAVTFSSAATAGHLIVLICGRPDNNTFTTQTGWTRRFRVQANPRLYLFDRIATAGFTTTNCVSGTSGNIIGQLLEFSGNSSSGYFDKVATATHNSATCNTGAHTETTNNLTPTNPDELLVSAFISNVGSLTASGHKAITGASSTGFTDTIGSGYNTATASFASGWGEAVNNPATVQNDTATFSGAAGTCSSDVAAYNAQITISQGSYRFFDNANSITPGGVLAAVNTAITLSQPSYKFRLRILLDIDAATGSLGLDAGDFILQYVIRPTSGNCADADTTDWQQVTDPVSANNPPIAFSPNGSVTDGTNITSTANDPADTPTYTTVLETYYGSDNNAGTPPDISNHQNALLNNQAGLWDLSLIDNTDNSQSHTYCLRLADSSGADLSAYRNYPVVTTLSVDVNIRGGSRIVGGTTIR